MAVAITYMHTLSLAFLHADGHILAPAMHTLLSVRRTDLGQLGFAALNLLLADVEPDAGHPMGEQREDSHEQGEHNRAVLRVPVQSRQQAQQAQQPHGLQQVSPNVLRLGKGGHAGPTLAHWYHPKLTTQPGHTDHVDLEGVQ